MKEEDLQKACVKALTALMGLGRLVFHHSPNEARTTVQHNAKRKAMGMQSGWPDLEIFQDRKCVFIELKLSKGRQTENQKRIEKHLKNHGFPYYLVKEVGAGYIKSSELIDRLTIISDIARKEVEKKAKEKAKRGVYGDL